MHISFRASALHKPIAPPNLPAAPATSSPVTTGSDFRNSLPPLAFSSRFPIRRKAVETSSKTPEMDAALAYVLQHKIKVLAEQLGHSAAANIWVANAHPQGFITKTDREDFQNISQSLAKYALNKHPGIILGMTEGNTVLTAQYAALLLMRSPHQRNKINQSHPVAKQENYKFKKAAETNIDEHVIAAAECVQDWLHRKDTQQKIATAKEKLDTLTPLRTLQQEVVKKGENLTTGEAQSAAKLTSAINQATQELAQAIDTLGEPELSDRALGAKYGLDLVADIESALAGRQAITGLPKSAEAEPDSGD